MPSAWMLLSRALWISSVVSDACESWLLGVVEDGVVVEVAHYDGLHDVLHHDVLHHYILASILFYIFNKICPKIYLVFGDKCFMLVLARPLEHNTGYL